MTEQSMAALDRSEDGANNNTPEAVAAAHERALAEARYAYLPSGTERDEGDALLLLRKARVRTRKNSRRLSFAPPNRLFCDSTVRFNLLAKVRGDCSVLECPDQLILSSLAIQKGTKDWR